MLNNLCYFKVFILGFFFLTTKIKSQNSLQGVIDIMEGYVKNLASKTESEFSSRCSKRSCDCSYIGCSNNLPALSCINSFNRVECSECYEKGLEKKKK